MNPTEVIEGQTATLTWSYSLTAEEQANSNFYTVIWFKFNSSSWVYAEIASYTVFNGRQSFTDPSDPRYAVGKPIASDSATFRINDVKRNDEGLYKIEYHLSSGKLYESEVNLTVLGKFFKNYDQYSMFVCCTSFHCNQQINVIIAQCHLTAVIHLQILLVILCVCMSCKFGGKLGTRLKDLKNTTYFFS